MALVWNEMKQQSKQHSSESEHAVQEIPLESFSIVYVAMCNTYKIIGKFVYNVVISV